MSLRKVYGGTLNGTGSCCDTCMFARIIQGYAESERIVTCAAQHPSVRLTFKVAECNSYRDKRLATYLEMSKIAWDVRPRSTSRATGFVSAPGKEESDPVKSKETAAEGDSF